jgi:energy-coupling factor transporter ATP-binding protein EcfA2
MRFSNFLSGFEGTRLSDAHINISQTGCLFSCYELNMVDQESQEGVYQLEELKRLISRISPGDRLKFYLRSDVCHTGINTSRDKAIEQIGRIEYRPFLVFESQSVTFGSLVRKYSFGKKNWHPESKFRQKIESLELNGNSLVSKKLDLKAFVGQTFGSQLQSQLILQRGLLGTTLGVSAILRLNKFKSNPINLETLSALKDQLKPPFLVCLSLSPYSREYSEALLRSRIGRSSSLESLQDQTRMADSEQDLQSVISDGERLFAIEMQILFFDKSEDDLKRSLSKAEASLSTLGDFEREHFGLRSCLKSMLPGNPQHNSLIEKQTLIPFFVPIFSRGGSSPSNSKRSLAIHRRDDSIDSFDLFDSRYDNYSACIFGKSGSGKSVLTNLLTRALHNDSSVKIIKIDVGGSHSKETRSLGGTEYKLSLDQPSGLNPFREATLCENREAAIGVLVSFLSVLILETGEAEVSKTIRGELESVLSEYLSSNPLSPSISDFYKFSARIPRKSLLKRWTNQGVFKNAFQECSNVQVEERLRYYNFSEIFQASDPDLDRVDWLR